VQNEIRVSIGYDTDLIEARQVGRQLALELGFSATDGTLIATAISELARNILLYAETGEILLRVIENNGRRGIVVIARDLGSLMLLAPCRAVTPPLEVWAAAWPGRGE
jgi:serine/threonine-protein kinase RsbT